MHKLILLLFFLNSFTFAQEESDDTPKTPFEYTKKIYKELEKIKTIKPENYFTSIDEYRVGLEKYIDHKKRVCEGEFSFIILNDPTVAKKNMSNKRNKLSKEEQALCFRELKALQITFINNMFVARKKYLGYLHERRLEELQSTRDKAVKELSKQFNKRVIKRKR